MAYEMNDSRKNIYVCVSVCDIMLEPKLAKNSKTW